MAHYVCGYEIRARFGHGYVIIKHPNGSISELDILDFMMDNEPILPFIFHHLKKYLVASDAYDASRYIAKRYEVFGN